MPPFDPKWNVHSPTRVEWPLILLALVLTGIGIVLIYSATVPMGEAGMSFVLRQMTWCAVGLVLMAGFLLLDYHLLDRWAFWFYLFMVVALIAVWALGRVTAGSRRWIDLGLMRFQPSEFAKLAVVLILAKYFQGRSGTGEFQLADLAHPLLLVAVPVGLVLIQPDLGTAGVIVLISVSMILAVGISRRGLLWITGVVVATVPILMLLREYLLMDYQAKRLLTFFSPSHDPLGSGYHIIQSQIAIGSGGMFGKGFLKGTQNQLMFLPVKHTDFIFAILAEEWGFVGCMAVLVLFSVLLLRGIGIAAKARDSFGALITFGCAILIFWHVLINVAMVMGLVPVVGVPLSFLSYGGSSLLSSFLAVAVMVNVSMRRFSY
jgi:rod shape determining protein RodA